MGEKDFFKNQIIEMISGIENKRLLEYLYHFIKLKIKAG